MGLAMSSRTEVPSRKSSNPRTVAAISTPTLPSAFADAGHSWTTEFCGKTFPGASMTTFGDPCCTWTEGDTPAFTVTAFTIQATVCASTTSSSTEATESPTTYPATETPATTAPPTTVPATTEPPANTDAQSSRCH
ncbi:hypothetical protein JG688_00009096 [Phytophthora aleatoria]|uniref:Uncharacterized protein n=1 Tax=Phytophthora aleatoria TaxID=2496075 RepID=A0A8J5J406_9STRA|nr:hypothetical protein JG688_00009096 [Phytophthora aleatoria]